MSDLINTSLIKGVLAMIILAFLIVIGVTFMISKNYNDNKINKTTNINRAERKEIKPRDYQIDIYNDTIWLYDRDRFVGKVVVDRKNYSPLDTLINFDNQ